MKLSVARINNGDGTNGFPSGTNFDLEAAWKDMPPQHSKGSAPVVTRNATNHVDSRSCKTGAGIESGPLGLSLRSE